MQSKEECVLEQFYNSPRHWRFAELEKTSGVSKARLSHWLKELTRRGLIRRVAREQSRPYYVRNQSAAYLQQKRLHAMGMLTNSGLLSHLATLPKAKVVIIFGSMAGHDWHKGSDVDVFIYGQATGLQKARYERALNREVQVHQAKSKKDLHRMRQLLPYVVSGVFVKGSIEDLDVKIDAKKE